MPLKDEFAILLEAILLQIDYMEETMSNQITPQEIKRIRKKYGLSQKAFARLLGIGEASMARYERGKEPTRANANLIRAADNPTFVLECLDRCDGLLTESQCKKTEQLVYSMVTLDDEGKIMDVNEIYMLTLEQEILNEQAAEIMADITRLYFAARDSGDTVHEVLYDDILNQIAAAKRRIIKESNKGKVQLAEIRGQINALKNFAFMSNARAA